MENIVVTPAPLGTCEVTNQYWGSVALYGLEPSN